jgi:hypothetical protein
MNEWYLSHLINCAGYKNLPLILNNYEFGTKSFPLKLNSGFESRFMKDNQLVPGMYNWYEKLSFKPFDYIIVAGHQYKDKLREVNALNSLESNYELVLQEGSKYLFKKRQDPVQ